MKSVFRLNVLRENKIIYVYMREEKRNNEKCAATCRRLSAGPIRRIPLPEAQSKIDEMLGECQKRVKIKAGTKFHRPVAKCNNKLATLASKNNNISQYRILTIQWGSQL